MQNEEAGLIRSDTMTPARGTLARPSFARHLPLERTIRDTWLCSPLAFGLANDGWASVPQANVNCMCIIAPKIDNKFKNNPKGLATFLNLS